MRNEFLKAEKYLIIDEAHKKIDELKEKVKQEVTDEMKADYEKMMQEMILMKFENVIEEMKKKREAAKQYGNISASEQYDYFLRSSRVRLTKEDGLELLRKMVVENEIPKIILSPPDEDGYKLEIKSLTKYELESVMKDIEEDDLSDKLYAEQVKKNLEKAREV